MNKKLKFSEKTLLVAIAAAVIAVIFPVVNPVKNGSLLNRPAEAVLTEQPRIAIEYAYTEARDFHEGLAAVKSKDAWGYINNLGHVVVPFVHRIPEAGDFSEGFAFVGDRYINQDGNPAFEERTFQGGLPFSQGLAAVQSGAQWGFIDTQGQFVIAPSFEAAGSFSSREDCDGEPLAAVRQNGLWGYIDKSGKMKIAPKYLHARPFSEGVAAVEIRGHYGYINSQDQIVIAPSFDEAGEFKYNLAPVKHIGGSYRAWGFFSRRQVKNSKGGVIWKNRLAIPYRYNAALSFSEATAAVATDSQWGFINVQGGKILSNQYDEARSFSEGLAAVRQDQYWGYIRAW